MAIGAVLGLLQFAPKLIGLFNPDSKGSKVSKIAETVADIALSVTGKSDVQGAVQALQADPQLAYQFEIAAMENETVLERLDEESRKRASEQYQVNNEQADKIAERVILWNLPIIALLIVVNVFSVKYFADNGPLIAVISGLIGSVITSLIAERLSVISFFFGSSLGSKEKAQKINLARG